MSFGVCEIFAHLEPIYLWKSNIWKQTISLLHEHSGIINLTCDVDKTVCMMVHRSVMTRLYRRFFLLLN